jgi:hypothetical protein
MDNLNCNEIPLNYKGLFEIDTNYGGTPNWVKLAQGITDITPANNDVVDEKYYYDGQGHGSSDVVGMHKIYTVTGDRILSDEAQNFVFANEDEIGCSRKTQFRATSADGIRKSGPCTIANITPPGGAANSKGAFTFEIHMNGKPTVTPATTAPALTAVVAVGTASGTTKFTATPDAGNTLGYLLTASTPTAPNLYASVNVLAYTSGDNIPASVGQVLNMVELDSNGRVAKYLAETLEALDIA